MVASGSLVWCWQDGRWIPLRLSSIKLTGAVTKAHWDAVNEFLNLAASQQLFLQEGSLVFNQKRGLCSSSKEKEFSNDSQIEVYANKKNVGNNVENNSGSFKVIDVRNCDNTSSNENLKTQEELNIDEIRGNIVNNDVVLSRFQNNYLKEIFYNIENLPAILPSTVKSSTCLEETEGNNNESHKFQNLLFENFNEDVNKNVLGATKEVNKNFTKIMIPEDRSFMDIIIKCLKEAKKNNKNFNREYPDTKNNDSSNEEDICSNNLSKINFLNLLEFLNQKNPAIQNEKLIKEINWQNLNIDEKNIKKCDLIDNCKIIQSPKKGEEGGEEENTTSLILKPLKENFDKSTVKGGKDDDRFDLPSDIPTSPLQRHFRKPMKHKQPCRLSHKYGEKFVQRRKSTFNRNNCHSQGDSEIEKQFSNVVLKEIPRVNSLSQTRLEWHQLIQDDKEEKKKSKLNIPNKNSFSKVGINVLNLQKFSKLVRQKKLCENNNVNDDKCKNKSKLKIVDVQKTDGALENEKISTDEESSLTISKNKFNNNNNNYNCDIDDYVDLPKKYSFTRVESEKFVPKLRLRKFSEDNTSKPFQFHNTNDEKTNKLKILSERKISREEDKDLNDVQKEWDSVLPFSSWLQKRKSVTEKPNIIFPIEEKEKLSNESNCQWQKILLKQNCAVPFFDKKPKRYRDAWKKNIRKISEGLRPLILQE